jgi:uncharacterized membrane protein
MAWLIVGLVLFLGAHSVRIFADGWREVTTWGNRGVGNTGAVAMRWKGGCPPVV